LKSSIQGRELENFIPFKFFVEDDCKNRNLRVDGRVAKEQKPVVDRDGHKEVHDGENCLNKANNHAAVHHELTQLGRSFVTQATMP